MNKTNYSKVKVRFVSSKLDLFHFTLKISDYSCNYCKRAIQIKKLEKCCDINN